MELGEWAHPFTYNPYAIINTQNSAAAIIGRIAGTTTTYAGIADVVRPNTGTYDFRVVIVGFGRWK